MQIIDESDPLDCEEIFRLKKKKMLHAWNDILPLLVEGWFDVEGPQDTRDIDEQRIEREVDPRARSAAKTEGQIEVLQARVCGLQKAFWPEFLRLRKHF